MYFYVDRIINKSILILYYIKFKNVQINGNFLILSNHKSIRKG